MKQDEKKETPNETSLSRAFTSDLRGRQSVRATFKLSEGCIEAISIVAAHLGIKQKSLFDHLAEDARSLRSIAREIQDAKLDKQGRIQKTYVISRRSLSSLENVSKNFNAPRDALVEFSVQRLLPIIAKERKKHEKRKQMLKEIGDHFEAGSELLNTLKESLDTEDPIFQKFESVMAVYENAYHHMASFIEKGKIIEEFQPDHLKSVWIIAQDSS
jgi:Mg2+ and Co2+ transporter CorA